MVRALAVIALIVPLSGCFLASGPGMFAVGTATFINTKKTFTDHAMSFLTGEDCSSLKYSTGDGYCEPFPSEEDGDAAAMAEGRGTFLGYGPYCYRTIGKVTCYNSPDPLASEYARLN